MSELSSRTTTCRKNISFFLAIFLSSCNLFAVPPSIKIEPLTYAPPQAERTVLTNGVVVYLQEDHELPLVYLNIRVKVNPSLEPATDAFEVFAGAWRTGGTISSRPQEMDQFLESTATDISISIDHESLSLSLSSLKKNWERALPKFLELMFKPAFDLEQFQLVQEQTLEGLRRQNESIAEIGRRAFRDVIFGPQHVYAQNPTINTISALTRSTMLNTHKLVLDPQGAIISVSGDFDKAAMLGELNTSLAGWMSSRKTLPEYDFSIKSPAAGKIFFVEKEFNQSRILMGRIGPSRHNPDQYALRMADSILGGGGPSRLFGEIRSRLGLAYMVGSVYAEREGPGSIAVVCQTMAPATLQAIQAISKELVKFSTAPPTQEELDIAKESTINSFVFGFLRPRDIVNARAENEFLGYASNYLDTFTSRIYTLTPSDIHRVAQQYYQPNDMQIVVVGNSKKMGDGLGTLGDVKMIPLDKLD